MIGILIVSHSKALAEGAVEVAKQMADERLPIKAVGGLDDGSIGTDAVRIMEGLYSVYTEEGVLVFVDLGSSVLSTQMAMDLLGDEKMKSNIHIVNAPIVEGSIVAALQASIEDPIESVIEEAENAWKMNKL